MPEIAECPPASPTDGVWLKGDWHIHTRHSHDSSNNPLEKIIGFAEAAGFDYLALTDHDVHVAGDVAHHTWADPAFRSDRLLLIHGAEVTAARGHFNSFAAAPYDHQRLFDSRDARDWDLLQVKRALGIHLSANHPGTKNHYGFSFDLADSVEVWNSSVWARNVTGLRIWDDMLKSGRMLGARGGSDCHHGTPDRPDLAGPHSDERLGNYVGTPTTWLFARDRSTPALLEALARGRGSISANPNNPRVELTADLTGDGRADMRMGDTVPATGAPVRFRVHLTGGGLAGVPYRAHVIRDRAPLGSFDIAPGADGVEFTDAPEVGLRSYYRVEIEGPQTPYPEVPLSMAQSGSMVALSNPLYFNYDPAF